MKLNAIIDRILIVLAFLWMIFTALDLNEIERKIDVIAIKQCVDRDVRR